MISKLQEEFERLESVLSQKEKATNGKLEQQMRKIKITLIKLNRLLKVPQAVRLLRAF